VSRFADGGAYRCPLHPSPTLPSKRNSNNRSSTSKVNRVYSSTNRGVLPASNVRRENFSTPTYVGLAQTYRPTSWTAFPPPGDSACQGHGHLGAKQSIARCGRNILPCWNGTGPAAMSAAAQSCLLVVPPATEDSPVPQIGDHRHVVPQNRQVGLQELCTSSMLPFAPGMHPVLRARCDRHITLRALPKGWSLRLMFAEEVRRPRSLIRDGKRTGLFRGTAGASTKLLGRFHAALYDLKQALVARHAAKSCGSRVPLLNLGIPIRPFTAVCRRPSAAVSSDPGISLSSRAGPETRFVLRVAKACGGNSS